MPPEKVPLKELAGLNLSLTLFRVFLEGYIGLKETDALMENVKKASAGKDASKPVHRMGEKEDFATYAELVRNSLRNLSARGVEKEKVEHAMREFDDFVRVMSTAELPATESSNGPKEAKKGSPENEDIWETDI
jgi:Arc/MetJ-type ribon-helix-helix transcriptional regulator